jgi:hypothetical protein
MRITSFILTKEEVIHMKYRWNTQQIDINVFFAEVQRLVRRIISPYKKGRGRPPKRRREVYLALLIAKEFEKRSLRWTEVCLSKSIVGERIDHSVLAYWEKRVATCKELCFVTRIIGRLLEQRLSSLFSVVDATQFTSWHGSLTEVHVCNRIARETVYPIGLSFHTKTVRGAVVECMPEGSGIIYADAWYDVNKAIQAMFMKGYTPIVCPNKTRGRGFYRQKARELYQLPEHKEGYRQRGRGESVFGSLTNWFGDRLHARTAATMRTRIAARMICYQLKLVMRVNQIRLFVIIRHALYKASFKYPVCI